MNREEYIQQLKEIYHQKDHVEDLEKRIEEYEHYKPQSVFVGALKTYAKITNSEKHTILTGDLTGTCCYYWPYEGIMEAIEMQRAAHEIRKSTYNVARMENLSKVINGDFSFYEELTQRCNEKEDFSFRLYKALYSCNEIVALVIYYMSFDEKELKNKGVAFFSNYFNLPNITMLANELKTDDKLCFCLIKDGIDDSLIELLNYRLNKMGIKTIVFDSFCEQIWRELEELKESSCLDKISILASGYTIQEMELARNLHFRRVTHSLFGNSEHTISLGEYGEYTTYISQIYCTDCKTLIDQETDKRFSIVIPVRNSSETLRYTLQTCLKQTYQGRYEIIVSDNSTGCDAAIYELCQEFDDDRIVYLKTPRDLHLSKSFEFAYLQAHGEYIFSIGADDGLLPWALEELDKIINRYPGEEIIQWERGFYAWPGFNGGQQNKMVIPRDYNREEYKVYYKDGRDYIAEILMNPRKKYGLPMLYINSCYRKSYLNTLLQKTGRLWDGVCQDIYMGIVTAAINPRILNMEFPLTIAGMSNSSVGANANRGVHTNAEFEKMMQRVQKDNNVGSYIKSPFEQFIPFTGTDTYSLYASFMRAISIGIIPEVYIDQVIPWKLWYQNLAMELDIMDVAFDAKIHEMRYCASLLGEDFLAWFDESIYEPLLKPVYIDEKPVYEKDEKPLRTYQVGRKGDGELTVDASEYGVSNVYEATELFVKLMQE